MENLKNEFVVLFRELTDNELVERFNQNVGNSSWNSARRCYVKTLFDELQYRNFDCTTIERGNTFSLQRYVILIENRLEYLD
ncbi:hypothetical protein HX096_15890 [Empedobacter falsenii]|uniref:hypothetical protein n=1 Tax=Empedobacter falsenii TaxID=343874 RepID=UPI002578CD78|nr:hypothetical protein [Empedobacter falsenii]MDM1549336.1 hypothetical protein [Empedobacter falsenii]